MIIALAFFPAVFALSTAPTAGQEAQGKPEFTRLGTCVLEVDGLEEPSGAAFASDGTLYVSESGGRRIRAIDSAGKTLRTFGAEHLRDPRDVAVANSGEVVVSDSGLDQVLVFSAAGELVRSIGSSGSKAGQLQGPEGLDVFDDRIAVADRLNSRVQIFRLSGEPLAVIGGFGGANGEFNAPADVAFAPDGGLYVADLFLQRVQQFNAAGEFVLAFGTPGPNPGQFGGPTGLAVHGQLVHVVDRDNSRVQVFGGNGELADWYGIHALRPREGLGKLHYPERIALNALATRAAVVEPVENRVQILGELDLEVPTLPPLPALPPSHFGGAVDADGPLFVLVEPSIPRVLLYQMVDGEPIEITRFGTYGVGPGQMLWPNDVAIDLATRRIFISDTGLARISVFGFRFDPSAPHQFEPERAHFIGQLDLGRVLWAIGEGGSGRLRPDGLWRDGAGGLCVVDSKLREIWRIDGNLTSGVRMPCPDTCLEPTDGCAGPLLPGQTARREQFVVDRLGGRVIALSDGRSVAEGFARPSAVLHTQTGETYVSDAGANALLLLGAERKTIAAGPGLGPNNLWRPRGLTELSGGRVLALDWGNHRGVIFDRTGKFLRAFGSQLFIRPTFGSEAPKTAEPQLTLNAPAPASAPPVLDGSKPWHSGHVLTSNAGNYAVFWKPTPDPIEERKTFSLEVWVTARATPNQLASAVSLALDAGMPEHAHGINVVPKVTALGDGHFRVDGTRLHMPGRWEMYFDVDAAGCTERAQVTLELE